VELAVTVEGEGPAVVFLHGYPLDRSIWAHQVAHLQGFRRIAPDLRGSGLSAPVTGEPLTMEDHAGDLIGLFQDSTVDDAERAIDAAATAYRSWRLVPAPRRAEMLFAAAQLIQARKEAFARDMTREMGKVLEETRGDVQEAIDMTYFMAGEGRRQYGQTVPSELRDKWAMSIRQSVGVCSIITPWNFPMAIPSWKIAPALVCGNTVVFKPATLTPLSAVNFVKVLEEVGIPPGVVNLVTGGPSVGAAMTSHESVKVVSFTGSSEVGRTVNQHAAPTFKKTHLEMGGKNVIMIMDDAQLDLAVEGCLWGGFGTTGQRCTAASRVVVHETVYDEFLRQFTARARGLRVGNGLDAQTQMGPSVSESQLQTVTKYVEIGRGEGARLAFGGERISRETKGYYLSPALFVDTDNRMRVNREEIFGPVATVVRVKGYEEALEVANDTEFGLSAGVVTTSLKHADDFKRRSRAGMVMVNLPTAGVDYHVPFGGTKGSSYGPREQGRYAREFYTTVKTAYVSS